MSETDQALQGEFARAAARTARGHLDAANCLLAGGFWPQAYALAVVGFEEAGKASLAVLKMLSPARLRNKGLADLSRDHVLKLGAAYSMLAMLRFANGVADASVTAEEAMLAVEGLAKKTHAGSQRGLYTDIRQRAIMSPADITEEEARELVADVEKVLDTGGVITDLATALWARGELPEEARAFLSRAAEAADNGEEAIGAFMQREIDAMDRSAAAMRDDPEVMQLIRDHPDWLRDMLRLASEAQPDVPQDPAATGD